MVVNRPLSTSDPKIAAPIALPLNNIVANNDTAVAR
jgi:hypothetical protein